MSGRFGVGKKSVEWYTPKWIFDELGTKFDLDPSYPEDTKANTPVRCVYTKKDNGLILPWHGYVFLNPPYGKDTPLWMDKMINHGNGLALVFSRTDSKWMQKCMAAANGFLFFAGRIAFDPGVENMHKKSRSGAGSCMLAFGLRALQDLRKLERHGILISTRK